MTKPIDLLRQGKKEELWQMCCGFIDLSVEEFMAIQKRLLLEHMAVLNASPLRRPGVKLLRSILGLGHFLPMLIAKEIDDISQFSDKKKLCAYTGKEEFSPGCPRSPPS